MSFDRSLRRRKTKDPCLVCFLHKSRCICELIPSLALNTRVELIVHAKELKRTTNTGRLALRALSNSAMWVRGEGRSALDLSGLVKADYHPLFLFPSGDAVDLCSLPFVGKPIQLIVPDGSWRQASKVHTRHPELKDVMRVKVPRPKSSELNLRVESSEDGMSTLEAIACALGVLEGSVAYAPLITLYHAKLQRTLEGRGAAIHLAKVQHRG